jgi:hypothetical protein
MKVTFFLALFLSLGTISSLYSSQSVISVFPFSRGVEIRYVEVTDRTQTEITVDDKTYKLFKTRNEAVEYATSLYPKRDYIVVYVMSDAPKTTEVVEIKD